MKRLLIACAAICAFLAGYITINADAVAAPPLTTLSETRSFTHTYPGQQYGFGAQGIITDNYVGVSRTVGFAPPTSPGVIFIHSPTTGDLLYELTPPPQFSNVNNYYGSSFDIQGNLAVVGADHEDLPKSGGGTAFNAGAAYLYDLTTGELRHKLVAAQPLGNGNFGSRVAVYGNTIAVSGDGYAHLFNAATGQQIARLDGGAQAVPRSFGAVAINDHFLLVAGKSAGALPQQNSVFVYDLATLSLQRIIRPADAASEEAFGTSIALDGNHAAIPDYYYGYSDGNPHFGAVYVFDVESGEQQAKLVSTPEVGLPSGFGYSVDILGKQLIVGAPGGNGSASLYDWTTGEALAKFTHSGVQSDVQFGVSVSLSNSNALVGTAHINVGPNTAYQYQLIPEPSCCALLAGAMVLTATRSIRLRRTTP